MRNNKMNNYICNMSCAELIYKKNIYWTDEGVEGKILSFL